MYCSKTCAMSIQVKLYRCNVCNARVDKHDVDACSKCSGLYKVGIEPILFDNG